MNNILNLHLGCGPKHMDGWINVDFFDNRNADVVTDLAAPWPWADGSVDKIYSNHVFEHLPFGHTFSECYRVLIMGGTVRFVVPHANTFVHLFNPTHITKFVWPTFDSWQDDNHSDYGFKMRWKVAYRRIHFLGPPPPGKTSFTRRCVNAIVEPTINTFPLLYERFFLYMIPACEIEYLLIKVPLDYNRFNEHFSGKLW